MRKGNAREGRTEPEVGAGGGLHPRNPHAAGYDFGALVAAEPGLAACVGRNPESDLIEIVEIPGLKWYIGTQFHPEYQSTVLKPHPLFVDFIKTAIENQKNK